MNINLLRHNKELIIFIAVFAAIICYSLLVRHGNELECSKGMAMLDPDQIVLTVLCEEPRSVITCKPETVHQAQDVIWCESIEGEEYRINGPINVLDSKKNRILFQMENGEAVIYKLPKE